MSIQSPSKNQLLRMLNQSGIQPEGENIHEQSTRLRQQLTEMKEQLAQKNKLVQVQKKTNLAFDQQLKTLKNRSQAQEERIKALESQLRNRRQETAPSDTNSSQISAEVQKLKSSQSELQKQLAAQLRQLLVQRKKCSEFSSLIKKKQFEQQSLNEENRLLSQKLQILQIASSTKEYDNSRQLQEMTNQLGKEKQKSNRLSDQVQELRKKVQLLTQSLKQPTKVQKKPQKVIETSPVVAQVPSKQSESIIKRLEAQISQLKQHKRLEALQKQKIRKELQSLKAQLRSQTVQMEDIKLKCIELQGELQKAKNGDASVQEFDQLPSNINQYSRIAKKFNDIDAEQLDQDKTIKVFHLHKELMQRLNDHLSSIPAQQKISLLSIVSCWCEEHQQKLCTSVNDLSQL